MLECKQYKSQVLPEVDLIAVLAPTGLVQIVLIELSPEIVYVGCGSRSIR
jgi:hypothetical protein